jgi:nucleoside-diphosphate-sugar epimerase
MGLTIVITGAGGFVGRAVVEAALRRGHKVRAVTRRDTDDFDPDVSHHVLDLARDVDILEHVVDGADAVIHAAASMSGDRERSAVDTVEATRNLLSSMNNYAPDCRLVLVSSIAVYDAAAKQITEDTPLERRPKSRDTYAQAKLAQEATLDGTGLETWIARPGAVFGPNHLWNAHLGPRFGPLLIRMGRAGDLPLVALDSCADALVLAAQTPVPGTGPRAVNLVESDLPTRTRFLRALGPSAPKLQIRFPWKLLWIIGTVLGLIPGLRRRLPGLLQSRTLRARFGEKHYSNARAEKELHWRSRLPFENAMHSAVEASR